MDILGITSLTIGEMALTIIGLATVIQVVPIKIDPWTVLLKWVGVKINGAIQEEIQELKRNIEDLKRDFSETKTECRRCDILNFSNSCRNGRRHSQEEWHHIIDQLKKYETYVEEKNIDNGVIEEETKYLRELYAKITRENDFLL